MDFSLNDEQQMIVKSTREFVVNELYPHEKEARISEVRHAFHDVVLSLMHTHCEPETCMDVLLVGGAPERVQGLAATLERMRDVHRSRLVVMA